MPPRPKAVLFDFDGTLADTMPLHWRAWQMITRRHDLHFPIDRFYSLGGVPSRDILKMLSGEQGRSLDHIAVAHEKEEAYLPLMVEVEPIHAVVEIAKANHGKIRHSTGDIDLDLNDSGFNANHSGGEDFGKHPASIGGDRQRARQLLDAEDAGRVAQSRRPRPRATRGFRSVADDASVWWLFPARLVPVVSQNVQVISVSDGGLPCPPACAAQLTRISSLPNLARALLKPATMAASSSPRSMELATSRRCCGKLGSSTHKAGKRSSSSR